MLADFIQLNTLLRRWQSDAIKFETKDGDLLVLREGRDSINRLQTLTNRFIVEVERKFLPQYYPERIHLSPTDLPNKDEIQTEDSDLKQAEEVCVIKGRYKRSP